MEQKRKEIIKQRNKNRRKQIAKKLALQANAAVVLLSSSYVLSVVQNQPEIAHAHSTQRMSPKQFIRNISKFAKNIANQNNLYASVMIAQASLESAWGNSTLAKAPNYNLFGIKGNFQGQSVEMKTLEDDGSGNYYQIKDNFRKYNSYEDSLLDYADVLTGKGSSWRKQFYEGALKSNTYSYRDATKHLTGRYATDTMYATKLNQIIERYNLTQYDTPGYKVRKAQPPQPSARSQQRKNRQTYIVQPGDGLYQIANDLGVSVDELLNANGLSIDSMIHANQSLVIPGGGNKVSNVNKDKNSNSKNNQSVGSQYYSVKSGDGLYKIAQDFNVPIESLLSANGLSIDSVIHPDQILTIPKSGNVNKMVNQSLGSSQDSSQTPNRYYTVQSGEGLYRISQTLGISMGDLLAANKLDENSVIHPGQQLVVPGTNSSEGVYQQEPQRVQSSYTVQSGDTLYQISQRYQVSVDELMSVNGMSGSPLIYPNQSLVIPSGKAYNTTTTDTNDSMSETDYYLNSYQSTSNAEVESSQAPITQSYTVQSGDNLYRIALNQGMELSELMSLNGLQSDSTILPGQTLIVK